MVRAEAGFDGAAFRRVVEDHVDHAGHRIGAVQRTGAVTQHFDALDRADRDGVEIHRRGALADLAVGVDQRAVVAALAVDQHQHLVRRQATQLRGAHMVGTAGVGLAREIERRQQGLQRAAQLAVDHAGLADVLGAEHVHRRGGFEHGAVHGAGAGDDHRVQRGGLVGGVLGEGGGRQRQRNGQTERGRGGAGHGNSGQTWGRGERNAYIHPDEAIYYLRVNTRSVASPIGNQLMTMCDIPSGAMDATVFPDFGGFP
ncbi:hypothetical protein D3C81_912280 [compost metagenome]